jgi:hypothetical protein
MNSRRNVIKIVAAIQFGMVHDLGQLAVVNQMGRIHLHTPSSLLQRQNARMVRRMDCPRFFQRHFTTINCRS